MLYKIDRMHNIFGHGEGYCQDCCHLVTTMPGTRSHFKCKIYGVTGSAASDWAKSYIACGMKGKSAEGMKQIITVREKEQKDIQVEGQISLFNEGSEPGKAKL